VKVILRCIRPGESSLRGVCDVTGSLKKWRGADWVHGSPTYVVYDASM